MALAPNAVGYSCLGAAGHEDVEPRAHGRLEEARGLWGEAAECHEVGEAVGAEQELANVDRQSLDH